MGEFIRYRYKFPLLSDDVAIDRLLRLLVFEAKGQAQEMHSSSPRGGRVYSRGKKSHKASAPGEAPAVDTGELMQSIYAKAPTGNTAEYGAAASYAGYLEEGTRKMAPRPMLNKAAEKALDKVLGEGLPFNVLVERIVETSG